MKRFRSLLLGLFLLGALGAGGELFLLGHYEEVWQLVPLILIGLSLTLLAVRLFVKNPRILRAFQACMVLFVVAGVAGVWLHYQSNIEFELEMNPAATGWGLIWESLRGAMPALAPGTMAYLGLTGFLYAWKHPALSISRTSQADQAEANEPRKTSGGNSIRRDHDPKS